MEVAYKMFNSDLTCTMGNGVFQYEAYKWYEEDSANVRANGFHACKNPLDCLNYYRDLDRCQAWMVVIDGDIDEDGGESALSAQKIYLRKRLNLTEFVAEACNYIIRHPDMPYNNNVTEGPARPNANHFAISVGPDARACGEVGDVLGILQTWEGGRNIRTATCIEIDGETYKAGVWYDANEMEVFPDDQEE